MRMPALRLGSATFAVVVTNPGDVALEAVGVLDPASPSCSRTIGALAAGGSVSYICHAPKVGRDFINRMTAVGRAPDGSRTLATTTATVKVKPAKRRRSHIHPIAAFTG
jgi:hypothetical protein